jgi:DNA-binding MarR family transcriptional regulator
LWTTAQAYLIGQNNSAAANERQANFAKEFASLEEWCLSIVSRYNGIVTTRITTGEYRALAELRYRIQRFLHDADTTARKAGLSPQHYLIMLAIRGLPLGAEATIGTLAERVALRHHSAVELIDRLEERGYVRRGRRQKDRRLVRVALLWSGERLLEEIVRRRLGELPSNGRRLVQTIDQILAYPCQPQRP